MTEDARSDGRGRRERVQDGSQAQSPQTAPETPQIRSQPVTHLYRGQRVRLHREKYPPSWVQFEGKTGIVSEPDNLGEVGVRIGGRTLWFLPDQLFKP